MKLFENEYVRISIDVRVPCLEWIGKSFMPSEEFRASEEKSLEFYLKHKDRYPHMGWFVDAREIGPISPQDTAWVAEEILPQFAAAGLTKEAFVVPKSALGRMVVKNYVSKAGKTIQMQIFDTVEAAKGWLKK